MEPTPPAQSLRRTVLKSLGALGALAGLGGRTAAGDRENVILLTSQPDEYVSYRIEVTGSIRPSSDTGGAPFDPDNVTFNPEDVQVTGDTVRGAIQGGVDGYAYTGTIQRFSTNDCRACTVYLNGIQLDECELEQNPDYSQRYEHGGRGGDHDDGGTWPSVVELRSPDGSEVTYHVVVSGTAWSTRRHSPATTRDSIRWHVGGDKPAFERIRYSGRLLKLEIGYDQADVTVRQR